jgi:hypothetical protein
MITVKTTRPEIETERKVWNPITRQHDIEKWKMKLIGVKIEVITKYGTTYAWKCYVRKGQRGGWKREKVNSASRVDYYTDDQVMDDLFNHEGLDGLDYFAEAKRLLDELCSKGHSVHPPIGV